ncbi:HipA N-terminal domain-containing protein [Phyllobacterium endophyticum]|uniref:HipA N-terminal domain-containing protein n=1 Tax=Phyllobacterium endophyticum TaxID=1149773 RepID=UPI001FE0EEAE|nr:HipA N-terminal domain-containing protein [Phyllobacterium endophyticum]
MTPVGQLRFTQTGPRQFSTFAQNPAWIENPRAFAVQPTFPVDAGPFHTSGQPRNMRDALAGVFADAAPDSWGTCQPSSRIRSRWHSSFNAPNMENGFY